MFAVLTAHGVVLIWRFIIVCQNGIVISKLKLVFFQKSHRVVFDRIGNLVFEKFQRLFSGGSDGVLGVTVRGFCTDQIGVDQIADDLLDTEIISVVLFEKKVFKIVNLYMVNGSAIYIHLFLFADCRFPAKLCLICIIFSLPGVPFLKTFPDRI